MIVDITGAFYEILNIVYHEKSPLRIRLTLVLAISSGARSLGTPSQVSAKSIASFTFSTLSSGLRMV